MVDTETEKTNDNVEEAKKELQKIKTERDAIAVQLKSLEVAENELKSKLDLELDSSDSEEEDEENGEILNSKLARITKLKRFEKGHNFAMFCERFLSYVRIANLKGPYLHEHLLQNVDDETYSVLRAVQLSRQEMKDPKLFCAMYREAIYGNAATVLKNDLLECRQKQEESISEYVFRLRAKSSVAYLDEKMARENCLLALLRGVRSKYMKQELNVACLVSFEAAVQLATRIEGVEKMMSDSEVPIA